MGADRALTPPTPREIRAELEELVVGDLYGPVGGDEHEQLSTTERVTDRYILGRLAPNGALVAPDDPDRFAESGVHESVSMADADTGDTEPEVPSVPSMFCNTHGFTVCVEPGTTGLLAHASWAVYRSVATPEGEGRPYRRHPHSAEVRVPLPEHDTLLQQIEPDPGLPAVVLRGRVRSYDGRRLVTLFLVNGQQGKESSQSKWLFQAELALTAADGHSPVFVPRPESFSGGDQSDRDEHRNLAMTHRFHAEFVVGHSTAVTVTTAPATRSGPSGWAPPPFPATSSGTPTSPPPARTGTFPNSRTWSWTWRCWDGRTARPRAWGRPSPPGHRIPGLDRAPEGQGGGPRRPPGARRHRLPGRRPRQPHRVPLHHNIETGVLVRDPGQVRRLIAHFDGLMGRGGPLERL
ncbi:hypothetical protein A6A08_05120 [Nocardiopsis sp. TSRI0078]|uniref:hypothetical protein n=1 Tax=unclassified Nocardiopsis TaxID=2649073 RepID=UPI00093BEF36|nr:hypothetical protein [Nocardiopsis sp. TSRI0078]OKI18989.1 hypothetical protein A6A08_05120 [Nocardiopsis sp. TSRI0078]